MPHVHFTTKVKHQYLGRRQGRTGQRQGPAPVEWGCVLTEWDGCDRWRGPATLASALWPSFPSCPELANPVASCLTVSSYLPSFLSFSLSPSFVLSFTEHIQRPLLKCQAPRTREVVAPPYSSSTLQGTDHTVLAFTGLYYGFAEWIRECNAISYFHACGLFDSFLLH